MNRGQIWGLSGGGGGRGQYELGTNGGGGAGYELGTMFFFGGVGGGGAFCMKTSFVVGG